VPEELMPPVEAGGVSAQKPFHADNPIRLRRLDHEVKVIRHEDKGVNLPAGLGASFTQRFDSAAARDWRSASCLKIGSRRSPRFMTW